jgi:hypothetical protein
MAILTISAESLGPELIAGIPMLVALSTNLPSTIYFTLDGSEPTLTSAVYIQPIQLPTDQISIQLRALAISGSDSGQLDVTYSVDSGIVDATTAYYGDSRGPIVDAYDVPEDFMDGYGPGDDLVVDEPVRYSDIPIEDLELQYSRTGPEGMGPGTLIAIGFPDTEVMARKVGAVDADASSPNNDNVFFNPRSLFITIDGRDGYQDQSVFIINRPWAGTMDITKYLGGKSLYEPSPYISGGFVRSFRDWEKGIIVFYYFDHNETRWIKSIQYLDPDKQPANIGNRNQTGGPLVFKWIHNRRSMI